jgi:hypothetical protein
MEPLNASIAGDRKMNAKSAQTIFQISAKWYN